MKETEIEEAVLAEKSKEFEAKIEKHLFQSYKNQENVKNGLAIVAIERGASEARSSSDLLSNADEIASRQKIITDEHSGRILVDAELAAEEKEKMNKIFSSK